MTKTTDTTGSLKDRAVLVRLSDRVWRGGIIDKQISSEVRTNAGAKKDVGHFWKRLLPKAALEPRINISSAMSRFHIANTLPWLENGVRILPVANYESYMQGMRKLVAQAGAAEKTLYKDYPTWIAEAKRSHGKLFNPDHFPTLQELKDKFSTLVDVIPLPNVTDWRVNLADDQLVELRRQATARLNEVHNEGLKDLYSRLHELLAHFKERLSDPKNTFRNTLVSNIKEFLPVMERLNVSNDKTLSEIAKTIGKDIASYATDDLRNDPDKRRKAAKDAGAIMKKMSAYMKR